LLLSGAADLLGIQAYVVGLGGHLLERQPRLVEAPGAGERLDVPERARREVASRIARSIATQHMSCEYRNFLGPPGVSQMPSSG
jgi:hypothetical protein